MSSRCRALPPGPDLVQNKARTAEIGQHRRSATVETRFRRPPRRPVRPLAPSRRIRSRRARLDPSQIRSEPLDQDLTALVRRYQFGLAILLKSPCAFSKTTRSPAQFESNCRSAQFLAFRPLNSLEIEPAVQPLVVLHVRPCV
jgi:hypothetical protein